MIRDRNIEWLRTPHRIPVQAMSGFGAQSIAHLHTITITGGVAAATGSILIGLGSDANAAALSKVAATDRTGITGVQSTSITVSPVSLGAGVPTLSEISTLNISGLEINAASDAIDHLDLVTPTLADLSEPIGVTVLWAHATGCALTDSITWRVRYSQADPGETLTAAATVLSTAIAAQLPVSTSGPKIKRSSRGIINANTFDATARRGSLTWNIDVSATSGFTLSAGSSEVWLLGLEIDYIPKATADLIERVNALISNGAE